MDTARTVMNAKQQPKPKPKMRRSLSNARGYSLVEVAIVLAVVGLMLSGLVVPVGRKLQERTYEKANDQIATAIDAVVAYASANRSPGVNLRFADLTAIAPGYGYRNVRVPVGRPYLPCPDIDGDGLENRRPYPWPTASQPRELQDVENRFATKDEGTPLAQDGACVSHHGLLPWRTLGIERGDPWGSLLSYAVSPSFSSAVYGFDQDTRAYTFKLDQEVGSLGSVRANHPNSRTSPLFACRPPAPPVVAATDACNLLNDSDRVLTQDSVRFISHASSPLPQLSTSFAARVPFVLTSYNLQGVDGLPFVIISHGQNKIGGAAIEVDPDPAITLPRNIVCSAASGYVSPSEIYNSLYGHCPLNPTFPTGVILPLDGEIFDRRQIPSTSDYINAVYALNRVPIYPWETGPVPIADSSTEGIYFDDVVGWLTRRELIGLLTETDLLPLDQTFDGLVAGHPSYPTP